MYFMFSCEGGAPKRRGPGVTYPSSTRPLSTGLVVAVQ